MNNLDLAKMRRIAENLHALAVSTQFGNAGISVLQNLTDAITQIYRIIEPASRQAPLKIFMRVGDPPIQAATAPKYDLPNALTINHELDGDCIVEVTQAGRLRVYEAVGIDVSALSATAIVYTYSDREEAFVIAGARYDLINPSGAHASMFSRPTYSSLEEALATYRSRVVRNTSCFILQEAWADAKRLFWRTKPEILMRRSLHQFLSNVFPDAEVRPEQIVDETHPVDIKVIWHETSKRALVEVKWLGDSKDETGHITVSYRDARAKEGAKQLADYLDSDHTAGPGLTSRGYLVVVDGRRRSLTETTTSVTSDDGLYYRDHEIAYDPDYHSTRTDFASPVRMFAEPVLN
ncbi:MAG: hypothetical protein ABSC92_08700 [Rhizomicrobium sp.]|jgi:hypothetical protein